MFALAILFMQGNGNINRGFTIRPSLNMGWIREIYLPHINHIPEKYIYSLLKCFSGEKKKQQTNQFALYLLSATLQRTMSPNETG